MKKTDLRKLWLVALVLALAACAPAATATLLPAATQTPAASPTNPPRPSSTPGPTNTPLPTATIQPTATLGTSFEAATYQDKDAGVKLDYPANWTLVPRTVIGSRGSKALLFSPGTSAEKIAPDGSRMGLTIYNWDPKKDLAAFVAHRQSAWDASGFMTTPYAAWVLADGRKVMSFIILTPDNQKTFFLLTTTGEDYLEISGEGNLPLIQEIAHTLRQDNP